MRYSAHALIVFLASVMLSSCNAQERSAGDCFTVQGSQKHDFGSITHGDKPSHAFVFHNACGDSMRFTAVKASCSCTAALPEDEVLAPGESTEIKVTFYPGRSMNGHVEKSVSVYVNDEARPRFILRVAADIRSFFSTDPEKVDMGRIPAGKEATATVRFTNVSEETQEIAAVQAVLSIENRGPDGSDPPMVEPVTTSSFDPSAFSLAPGATQEITVRFTPHATGRLLGSVLVYSGPEARQIEFSGIVE
ncbi:MAG: DUF1573 domain-containing protein [Bacteroidota bacterium]|nr:DUF1573 domain-containing protein [Bacteroidota bacterium]